MATKKKETLEVSDSKPAKSYQDQLNDVDNQIKSLIEKKKELAKMALKEAESIVEMPLHQLNAIGQMGYEKAKESYGKKWVE